MKIENMPKKLKEIPIFKSEDEEREFWSKENSTDYIDWDLAETKGFTETQTDDADDFSADFRSHAGENPSRSPTSAMFRINR